MQKKRLKIVAGDVEVTASLNDSDTAGLVWDELPMSASVSTWGDEIYFRTDLSVSEDRSEERRVRERV